MHRQATTLYRFGNAAGVIVAVYFFEQYSHLICGRCTLPMRTYSCTGLLLELHAQPEAGFKERVGGRL